jgi:hypothetical protein
VKTLLRMLHATMWMLPAQRAMLLLGAGLCIGGAVSGKWQPSGPIMLALILPLLTCGVFLRKLAAPRHAQLWPHARPLLLLGALGTMAVATLLFVVAFGLDFLRAPPRYKPDLEGYGMVYVSLFVFWSQCTISTFVASRSPKWALLVLGLWLLPGIVMHQLGIESIPRKLTGLEGLAISGVAWIGFATWFLKVRSIGDSGWRMRAGGVATTPQAAEQPASREHAMQRWLLNSATPLSIGAQWGLAALILVAVQLGLPLLMGGESPPTWVTSMVFGTLSLGAAAIGAVSWGIARRSRWLWLTAGMSRLQLFGWCERLMLKVLLAVLLPLAVLGAALWLLLEARPAMHPLHLLLALVAPALAATWFGLMQVHRRISLDGVAALLVLAGWFFGLIRPLFLGQADPRWEILFFQLVLAGLLREVAYVRWRAADWPRARPGESFGE